MPKYTEAQGYLSPSYAVTWHASNLRSTRSLGGVSMRGNYVLAQSQL